MNQRSSSSSTSSRYYDNAFEDYDEKKKIPDNFQESLSMSIKGLLQKLERNRSSFENSNDSSIYTGTTGIAYLYYNYGKNNNDKAYIDKAAEMIDESSRKLKASKRSITFLTGNAGPLSLGAIINHLHGDKNKSLAMISDLRALSKHVSNRNTDCPDELLYGRAGYLYAILFVNTHISPAPFDEDFIKEIIRWILNSGKNTSESTHSESPLMYSWHDKLYLGGAHGLAGILYVLLQARSYLTEYQLNEQIEPSIRFLMRMRFLSGNFPSSLGNQSDKLVHWCHGAPSMTMLFSEAYLYFNNPEYLEVALNCGDVVWSRGILKKGYGICHGVAGNAYTFLNLYGLTKDIKHLYRASKFAEWCMDYGKHQERSPDRPFSLFEGLAGTIYFLIDICNPLSAKFPAYTV